MRRTAHASERCAMFCWTTWWPGCGGKKCGTLPAKAKLVDGIEATAPGQAGLAGSARPRDLSLLLSPRNRSVMCSPSCRINHAPVLTLWATVVAERLVG